MFDANLLQLEESQKDNRPAEVFYERSNELKTQMTSICDKLEKVEFLSGI